MTTEPVRCPEGTLFDTEEGVEDVGVETTDLDARSDDVEAPAPGRPVCLSGGAPCTEGGG